MSDISAAGESNSHWYNQRQNRDDLHVEKEITDINFLSCTANSRPTSLLAAKQKQTHKSKGCCNKSEKNINECPYRTVRTVSILATIIVAKKYTMKKCYFVVKRVMIHERFAHH